MPAPEKVLIHHDDYRFKHVGKFADGRQYMAFISGAFPGEGHFPPPYPIDAHDIKRWLVFIHIFDKEGNYLETDVRHSESGTPVQEIWKRCDLAFAKLCEDYGISQENSRPVWIKPFRAVIDDIYYELIYKVTRYPDDDKEYESATLFPQDVVFYPPWNTEIYDT